jgi:hypothetical protein
MSVASQLSSMSTSLRELTTRITDVAESLAGTDQDNVAGALYEVERALNAAARRLDKVVGDLD